jgi:hypothetical protein
MSSAIPRLPGRGQLVIGLLVAVAASGAASAVASTRAPRLAHEPVVTFDRRHPGSGLVGYVRFEQRVTRSATGAPEVRLGISAPNASLQTAATAGRLHRACYSTNLYGGPRHPRTGARVKLLIQTGPRSDPTRRTITVRLRGLNKMASHARDDVVLQDLGCVKTHR